MAGQASLGCAGPGAASTTTQQHIAPLWSLGGEWGSAWSHPILEQPLEEPRGHRVGIP